jgi:hypothetical protein
MSGRVNIGAVFNLDRINLRLHKAPELFLDVGLGHSDPVIRVRELVALAPLRLWRRVTLEPHLPELIVTCLETRQTVLLSLIKPVVAASPEEASVTEPLALRDGLKRGVKTEHVEP